MGSLTLMPACSDFLDVNTNPNAPQEVSANLYLPPMLHWMVTGPQFDGRFIGIYTQQWRSTSTAASPQSTFGRMGYDPGNDNGGEVWRNVYWHLGQNLVDMNTKAEAEQRWDLLGVGLILKAWGWHTAAGEYGEIIVKEAINPSTFSFNYDSQQYAYEEAQRLLVRAIELLQRSDGEVSQVYLMRGDKIYNGDRAKWLKFAYGLLAINLNHYSNKASYDPDSVIALVDRSFVNNADDALLTYPNTNNDDINFWGRTRNNITAYRQTQFVVNLMNGTRTPGVVDPRMSRMLAIDSLNTTYRGLTVNGSAFDGLAAPQQPRNFHGYTGTGGIQLPGRYIFDDKAKIPAMTYAQLQFVKAEAAYHAGLKPLALTAYRNGISAHIDFVNARNQDNNQIATQITAAEKAAYLAAPEIVPTDPNLLTLSQIMVEKYIAQWGWGHPELWMDMRRYGYTELDPVTGVQIYPGFVPPSPLYTDNNGKVVMRLRPRYNSEYIWNRPGLAAIGGLDADYQTDTLWITKP
jgi:hypothetical protein